jgi:hypothetical protein
MQAAGTVQFAATADGAVKEVCRRRREAFFGESSGRDKVEGNETDMAQRRMSSRGLLRPYIRATPPLCVLGDAAVTRRRGAMSLRRAGSWRYDAQGTAQLTALIMQAAALGFKALDVSRTPLTVPAMCGVSERPKHLLVCGACGACGAGAGNGGPTTSSATRAPPPRPTSARPPTVADLLRWHDDMDLLPPLGTGMPCHNGGSAACCGGPGCCSLCSATDFNDALEAIISTFGTGRA